MGLLDEISQKIKGKGQKVKGKIRAQRGDTLRGNVDKVKGGINDTVADLRLRRRKNKY